MPAAEDAGTEPCRRRHQVNVLVFGPGGYRFADYTKVGVWLNLILFILTALVLPLIWPLTP